MDDAADSARLQARLDAVVARRLGEGARVRSLRRMAGGHAGFTYGFEYAVGDGPSRAAVVKLGPPGVRRAGVADVYRQAPLLTALLAHGVPVPRLLWADPEEADLGAPYIVMELVPGRERFPLLRRGESVAPLEARAVWSGAIEALARLDRFPSACGPAIGQTPVPLDEELAGWEATLRKAPDRSWIDAGLRARDALAARLPRGLPVALSHGDFQPSNLLFDRGRLRAIIDWDLAKLGARGLDLGWLTMWADPEYWGPHWRTWCPLTIDELVARFEADAGRAASAPAWFRAFAGYRFGAIACLNVHLHRSGRRPDPVWDVFAADIPRLFARAAHLANDVPGP